MPVPLIELTKQDLFAAPGWKSEQVSVLGFHLGMSWSEALATARAQRLRVYDSTKPASKPDCSGKGRCSVEWSSGVFSGVHLTFGPTSKIVEVTIDKPNDAGIDPGFAANMVARKLKGKTLSFFNHYSREERLKLLGPEGQLKSDNYGSTTLLYPDRGITFELDPCPSYPLENPCSTLIVSFVPSG